MTDGLGMNGSTKDDLRIWYCDFWVSFDFKSTLIYTILCKKYNVIFDEDNPEVLFYSVRRFGTRNLKYNCFKIQVSGECPNMLDSKGYSLGYDKNSDKYCHILWQFINGNDIFHDTININFTGKREVQKNQRGFCCFLVSNPCNTMPTTNCVNGAIKRQEFFKYLSENYKKVNSGGRVLNNIGKIIPYTVEAMGDFYRNHKFSISYENLSYPGYLTEKIFIPLSYGCIPIYYGDTEVEKVVNPKCFINANKYTDSELVDIISEIDNNDDMRYQMQSEPVFVEGNYISKMYEEVETFLLNIIDNNVKVSK